MELALQQLIPLPLKEKVTDKSSDIWKQNVQFTKGELVFVQAPSGTGKTTLMHMLYGLRSDYEGTVLWDETPISQLSEEQLSPLRATYVSIVFQDLRLFPEMTALENLELKRTLTNSVSKDQVEDMLRKLGIYEKRNALARTLSYGEQQRVSIIRALLQPFDWLLMDEPFSHLDSVNIDKAVALIQEVIMVNKAGLILADLEKNAYFSYHKRLFL